MEKKQPEITTIIPTYKRPDLLKRAIESVLNQTYSNLKVMVIDDVSNDDTFNVVSEYIKKDKRVSYHCHKKNIGGNRNFNFGLTHVTTPFFSFLSNDDIYLPEFYETAIEFLLKFPEIGFCATEVKSINNKGITLSLSNTGFREGYHNVQEGMLKILENGHPPCWTGIVFKSTIINKIGTLDEDVGGSMDYDFVQRAAAYFPYYISKKVGAAFYVHESSWGQSSGYKFVWPSWNKMISNIVDDKEISLHIRKKFKRFYTKELKRKIYFFGRQDIKYKNFSSAYECASILSNDLKSKWLSIQLKFIGTILENFPGIHSYILFLMKFKNWAYQLKNIKLIGKFNRTNN